ncbi:hypothetical protein EJ05DRAFT_480679 [Pseudovirgaria hyperparasitica]|uniref:Uncharacterized protein n=1 Tax=Pseudovirgaria hyperparasitica TaxID=470096 RepID=A0A6A6VTW6_9PEZI|nr:uncharacterized protein EJ05DRAFT_480679 [Pseudovirgaria hyperparasitica]KAF2753174.1 hypothetical protein EJ05DRAFT_480679 [Pseudovirgaria hyperparasitica]
MAPNVATQTPLPFVRAYSYVLRNHDVHETDFLRLIDQLSIVQATHPPSQMAEEGVIALGMPYHWAQFAGLGSQIGTEIGDTALLTVRGRRFVDHVNKSFLRPRGLQMRILTDDDIVSIIGVPAERDPLS